MHRLDSAKRALGLAAALLAATSAAAQGSARIPLNDLGTGFYGGFQGGLYPGGSNAPPAAHLAAALVRAGQIVPRDAAGAEDPDGFIAMVAIGMSNTTHEFAVFERNEDANASRNARVVLIDTALGGQDASIVADPTAAYWTVLAQRLAALGLTGAQVQVAWLKEAEAQPPNDFPGHALALRDNLATIARNLHDKFPNLKLCYVSSRIYGGYATGSLNPEPQAYESGFSVKWLIEDQIGGDASLSYGQVGPARAPLLLWGPYLWADGTHPRSDGLVWRREDLEGDGTHPSASGEAKVASLLSAFFAADVTARPWWPARGDSRLFSIDALRDAHVLSSEPAGNFGSTPQLLARGGASIAEAFLAFDLGAAPRPVALAKLGLRVLQAGGGEVGLVADASWGETTITWNDAPAIGPRVALLPQSSRDGTIGADATGAVNADADGLVSFALRAPGSAQASYSSREGGQPPRLTLVVACPVDGDGDGVGDACDCAPGDPAASAPPAEVRDLRFAAAATLVWSSAAPGAGSSTVHDLLAGELEELALPGARAGDVCLAHDLAGSTLVDPTPAPAPGKARFFLVRGRNVCGVGSWGVTSDACP